MSCKGFLYCLICSSQIGFESCCEINKLQSDVFTFDDKYYIQIRQYCSCSSSKENESQLICCCYLQTCTQCSFFFSNSDNTIDIAITKKTKISPMMSIDKNEINNFLLFPCTYLYKLFDFYCFMCHIIKTLPLFNFTIILLFYITVK